MIWRQTLKSTNPGCQTELPLACGCLTVAKAKPRVFCMCLCDTHRRVMVKDPMLNTPCIPQHWLQNKTGVCVHKLIQEWKAGVWKWMCLHVHAKSCRWTDRAGDHFSSQSEKVGLTRLEKNRPWSFTTHSSSERCDYKVTLDHFHNSSFTHATLGYPRPGRWNDQHLNLADF